MRLCEFAQFWAGIERQPETDTGGAADGCTVSRWPAKAAFRPQGRITRGDSIAFNTPLNEPGGFLLGWRLWAPKVDTWTGLSGNRCLRSVGENLSGSPTRAE